MGIEVAPLERVAERLRRACGRVSRKAGLQRLRFALSNWTAKLLFSARRSCAATGAQLAPEEP